MTDSKTKAINGIHDVSDTAQQTKSKIWDLLTLAKEVSNDVEGFQSYEKSMEQRKVLEQELEAKTGEAQRLRDLNEKILREYSEYKTQSNNRADTLFTEFERKFKSFESDKAAVEAAEKKALDMEGRMKSMKVMGKERLGEIEKLKQRLVSVEEVIIGQEKKLNEAEALNRVHEERVEKDSDDLRMCQELLTQAQTDLGERGLQLYGPDELEQLGSDLAALSKKSHDLVVEYFSDLDGAKDSGSEVLDLKARFPKIPLTTATTRAAAQMRCIIAEAVIAEVLTNQIFVPFYLANGLKTAASALLDYFGDNEHRHTIYRCQVLQSMDDSEDTTRIEEDIIRKASNEVRTTLHPLVVAFKQAGFYNAVPVFFREALRLWSEVQRSRHMITAEAPSMNEEQPPNQYDEYDQASGYTRPKGSKSPVEKAIAAVLFPQVGTRDELVFGGVVLWSNQTAILAAAQEMPAGRVNGDASKPVMGRRRSMVGSEPPFRGK